MIDTRDLECAEISAVDIDCRRVLVVLRGRRAGQIQNKIGPAGWAVLILMLEGAGGCAGHARHSCGERPHRLNGRFMPFSMIWSLPSGRLGFGWG